MDIHLKSNGASGSSGDPGISLSEHDTSPPSSPDSVVPVRLIREHPFRILEDSEYKESDLSPVPSDFSLNSEPCEESTDSSSASLTVLQLLQRRNALYQEELLYQVAAIDAACQSSVPILIEKTCCCTLLLVKFLH